MARFDFTRRRGGNEQPMVLGLVVPETAINSRELLLLDRLHLAIMAETKGLSIIFQEGADVTPGLMLQQRTELGEDHTFGNQLRFKEAMGLGERYPSIDEAVAWRNEIVARAYATFWPAIEEARAEGPDR
jgi:hypothetical protein